MKSIAKIPLAIIALAFAYAVLRQFLSWHWPLIVLGFILLLIFYIWINEDTYQPPIQDPLALTDEDPDFIEGRKQVTPAKAREIAFQKMPNRVKDEIPRRRY
jgi:hypothetical protein